MKDKRFLTDSEKNALIRKKMFFVGCIQIMIGVPILFILNFLFDISFVTSLLFLFLFIILVIIVCSYWKYFIKNKSLRDKYTEQEIEDMFLNDLSLKGFFYCFWTAAVVSGFIVGSSLVSEITEIQEECWIWKTQAIKIMRLPDEETEMVRKQCKIKKETLGVTRLINELAGKNQQSICKYSDTALEDINTFLRQPKEKQKIMLEPIKNVISKEINRCKEDIIAKKVETMDSNFEGDFSSELNNLSKFQERINNI